MNSTAFTGFRAVLAVQDQLAARGVPSAVMAPDVDGIDLLVPGTTIQVKAARYNNGVAHNLMVTLAGYRAGLSVASKPSPRSKAAVFVFVSPDRKRFWVVRGDDLWAYVDSRKPYAVHRNCKYAREGRSVNVSMRPEWEDRWDLIA